jgi:peptidyl-prolyl cis-trans isomerase SurA
MIMNFRLWLPALGLLGCSLSPGLHAQTTQAADFIVAVVNSEPITNSELRNALQRATRDFAQQRAAPPPAAELQRLVLERLPWTRLNWRLHGKTKWTCQS